MRTSDSQRPDEQMYPAVSVVELGSIGGHLSSDPSDFADLVLRSCEETDAWGVLLQAGRNKRIVKSASNLGNLAMFLSLYDASVAIPFRLERCDRDVAIPIAATTADRARAVEYMGLAEVALSRAGFRVVERSKAGRTWRAGEGPDAITVSTRWGLGETAIGDYSAALDVAMTKIAESGQNEEVGTDE